MSCAAVEPCAEGGILREQVEPAKVDCVPGTIVSELEESTGRDTLGQGVCEARLATCLREAWQKASWAPRALLSYVVGCLQMSPSIFSQLELVLEWNECNRDRMREQLTKQCRIRSEEEFPVRGLALVMLEILCLTSRLCQRSKTVRFACERVDWFDRLVSLGTGSYGSVKRMDEAIKARYELVGSTAVKRVCLFSRGDGGVQLSSSSVCEIVTMFALEGLSREENDVLAPIVKTVIIDDVAGFMYLAMTEFNESLSDVLDRGEVLMNPEDMALSLSYLVARMHSLGIVHMDIKTCNILVAQHQLLVLGDFGMARMVNSQGRLERREHTFTTVTHRAPELMLGADEIGPWNDVWSMGIVVAQCLERRVYLCRDLSEYTQLLRIAWMQGAPSEDEVGVHDLALPEWPKRSAGRYFCQNKLEWEGGDRARRAVERFLDESLQWSCVKRPSSHSLNKMLYEMLDAEKK